MKILILLSNVKVQAIAPDIKRQPARVCPGVCDGQISLLQLWQAPVSFEW